MMVEGKKEKGKTDKTLPDGWRWVKLGDVIASTQPGFACGQRNENGVIQLRMNNVNTSGVVDLEDHIRIPSELVKGDRYFLQPNDVLFNNTNSVELVGKSALFIGHNEPVVFSNHFTRLRPIEDCLLPPFLVFLLVRQWQSGVFQELCNRWVGQSAVNMGKLLNLEIPLPPIEEQRRIVAILSERLAAVDQARQATQAQLEAAQALPAAYLREIFNSPEAQTWERKRLGDIAETSSGSTPSRQRDDYYIGEIPWVKTGELKDDIICDTEEHISELALKETSVKLLPKDSLLVAMYGQGQTRGRTGILTLPATTNQACFAIQPNDKLFDTRYLQFWFRHNYNRLREETEGRGGNQPNLNGDLLRGQMIALPSVNVQKGIIEKLQESGQEVDKLKQSLQDQIDTINTLPAALLRQAFSGEL